jgi:hypothetical protein
MDPTTLSVIFGLLENGPAALALAQRTYALFTRGAISLDELAQLWALKVQMVKQAEGQWLAAAQQSQPVQPAA